ncbi:hypothetical protein K439DRAFT_1529675 [Ramaria rubella]|nr:hypothetical protein K439DRAFT_1529675 [Ramaria rubella]
MDMTQVQVLPCGPTVIYEDVEHHFKMTSPKTESTTEESCFSMHHPWLYVYAVHAEYTYSASVKRPLYMCCDPCSTNMPNPLQGYHSGHFMAVLMDVSMAVLKCGESAEKLAKPFEL